MTMPFPVLAGHWVAICSVMIGIAGPHSSVYVSSHLLTRACGSACKVTSSTPRDVFQTGAQSSVVQAVTIEYRLTMAWRQCLPKQQSSELNRKCQLANPHL